MSENRPPAAHPGPTDPDRMPVGKTTTTMHLPIPAGTLLVDLVDLDGQGNASFPLVARHGDEPTAGTISGNDRP